MLQEPTPYLNPEIDNPSQVEEYQAELFEKEQTKSDQKVLCNQQESITTSEITDNHTLNNLSGSEWALHSKSVQKWDSPITIKRKEHGAAFPIDLAKHFIKVYSKENDKVFDPFAGVGTTLDASNILKRHAYGTELNSKFVDMFTQGIDKKDGKYNPDYDRIVYNDSASNLLQYVEPNSIDLILTSPPYANLLKIIRKKFADKDFKNNIYKNQSRKLAEPYSNNSLDFGNLDYKNYLNNISELMKNLHDISKEGVYNVWVVRDYRDMKNNIPYVNLHSDIIKIAIENDWKLWDIVIWDQSEQRKLVRLGGNKARRFYFNIGFSFVLIFRKNFYQEKFTNEY